MRSYHILFLFFVALSAIIASLLVSAEDVVRVKGRSTPNVLAAPLTPSLQCSACEVTCREVYNSYKKKSKNVKFYGTDVELADLMESVCDRIPSIYVLRQENFGARLKVFADPRFHFDIQSTEKVEYYHELDAQRYQNSVHRLRRFCQTFVDKFYDSHFRRHVFDRSDEQTLRLDMCSHNATKLCAQETLEPYMKIESRKRRRWKKRQSQKRLVEEKIKEELNEKLGMREVDEDELSSTEEL